MKTRYLVCQHVLMSLQVARWGANVEPIGAWGDVCIEGLAFLEQLWEQIVFERVIFALRNQIQNLWFEHISAGINVSAVGLAGLGFLDEAKHAAVFAGLDNTVHAGILDGSQEDRRGGPSLFVLPNH